MLVKSAAGPEKCMKSGNNICVYAAQTRPAWTRLCFSLREIFKTEYMFHFSIHLFLFASFFKVHRSLACYNRFIRCIVFLLEERAGSMATEEEPPKKPAEIFKSASFSRYAALLSFVGCSLSFHQPTQHLYLRGFVI